MLDKSAKVHLINGINITDYRPQTRTSCNEMNERQTSPACYLNTDYRFKRCIKTQLQHLTEEHNDKHDWIDELNEIWLEGNCSVYGSTHIYISI